MKKGYLQICALLYCLLFITKDLSALNQTQATTSEEHKTASINAANAWLNLVDSGNYDESWSQMSIRLRMIMSKDDWHKYLTAIRAPLGKVLSRKMKTELPAENPEGLPPGDYMVILYETSFAKGPAKELLTMVISNDGLWHVLTYHVTSQASS